MVYWIICGQWIKKLFSIDCVDNIFSRYFFQWILPRGKCGFTAHCLYRNSITLKSCYHNFPIYFLPLLYSTFLICKFTTFLLKTFSLCILWIRIDQFSLCLCFLSCLVSTKERGNKHKLSPGREFFFAKCTQFLFNIYG